jgi:hypothetical protein
MNSRRLNWLNCIGFPTSRNYTREDKPIRGNQSVVRTRDRVAGAGYACNARPDLHTVCRSFRKISSALSAKVCGGSRSAKILIRVRFGRMFLQLNADPTLIWPAHGYRRHRHVRRIRSSRATAARRHWSTGRSSRFRFQPKQRPRRSIASAGAGAAHSRQSGEAPVRQYQRALPQRFRLSLRRDGGFVDFRWTGHATPTIGKVVPSTARPANQGPNSFLRGG